MFYYFSQPSKRNLGLLSLIVLGSLSCSQQTFAMTRPYDDKGKEQGDHKKQKITTEQKIPTRKEVDTLIVLANENGENAQDELMKIVWNLLYRDYLTPDKIKFLSWNNIEKRCYEKDVYSYYVIQHFEKIKGHFSYHLAIS